jgi:hypothetical protein
MMPMEGVTAISAVFWRIDFIQTFRRNIERINKAAATPRACVEL